MRVGRGGVGFLGGGDFLTEPCQFRIERRPVRQQRRQLLVALVEFLFQPFQLVDGLRRRTGAAGFGTLAGSNVRPAAGLAPVE